MTKLALLWHMHQPFYQDLATGEHILPWVRLHAIKDYVGMVAMLGEFPRVRATFNLVPSLLVQVQAFAGNRAHDPHLEVGLKPAADLDADERALLLANGFHAPFHRMILPYPRYAALHAMARTPEEWTVADLRDLQVWHKLAWMDPDWLLTDPRLTALVQQDHGFAEADKQRLREVELELLNAMIPAYRAAAARGQVELSTSPFYHPILPLLCDTDAHLAAHPHSALPRGLFRRPADARLQLERAVAFHRETFGERPRGVWPSEGAIADEVIPLLVEAGFEWAATDEELLARSLGRRISAQDLYRPYEIAIGSARVRCLFRDHGLSDLIGFAYQSWEAEAAADDFLLKVRDAARRFRSAGGEAPTIAVMLDGENAWEHYPGGGRPFLRALYARLAAATDIQTVTMTEAIAGAATPLNHVFPGSWINGDLYIWAGHADDHRAWAQLAAARAVFDDAAPQVDEEARRRALEELLIAEGSDWFWWYGDDHSSDHDLAFDDLFRRQLRNVYRTLGRTPPDDLHVTNITTTATPVAGRLEVQGFIAPTLDGRATRFSEWVGAAPVHLGGGGGAMHRVTGSMVRDIRIGVSRSELFLRIDAPDFLRRRDEDRLQLVVLLDRPRRLRVNLSPGSPPGVRVAADAVIEAAIPFARLEAQGGDRLRLRVLIADADGHQVEQHPALHAIELDVPTRQLAAQNWAV